MTNQLDAQEFEKEILSIFINEIRRRIIVCIDKNCDFSAVYYLSNELSKLVAFAIVEPIFIDYFKNKIGQHQSQIPETLDELALAMDKAKYVPQTEEMRKKSMEELVTNINKELYDSRLGGWDDIILKKDSYQLLVGELKKIIIQQAVLIYRAQMFYEKTGKPLVLIQNTNAIGYFYELNPIISYFLQKEVGWVTVPPESMVVQSKSEIAQLESKIVQPVEGNGRDKDTLAAQWKKFWENVSVAGVGIAAAVGAYHLYQYMTQSEK